MSDRRSLGNWILNEALAFRAQWMQKAANTRMQFTGVAILKWPRQEEEEEKDEGIRDSFSLLNDVEVPFLPTFQ